MKYLASSIATLKKSASIAYTKWFPVDSFAPGYFYKNSSALIKIVSIMLKFSSY